ncbi:hypothetical protein FVA95_27305 [Pseudonocardia sp. EV170527-09]|uniref:hypothetical protein n=1 Tax=Pseudonocardia sp. EV170527-09 TaxID=2603411 RepID=UPI0012549E9F|nr:hypothetical protein [Pseudonocardia sp. EV170527-09]KAA1012291.1 hypothetical protein FVA95_27305 [Pseudonocardia sp. EV170527-09]
MAGTIGPDTDKNSDMRRQFSDPYGDNTDPDHDSPTGSGSGRAGDEAGPRGGAAAAALTALTALCVLGSTATAAPGIAAAALGIDYEKAGNFPTLDACADAGHTMPDIKTWLCDEEDDGTVSGTVRA